MVRLASIRLLVAAVATIVCVEREVSACGTCDTNGNVWLPGGSGTWPANAGFLVGNADDPTEDVHVWVAGEPATLELVEGASFRVDGRRWDAVRVVPQPPAGATLDILEPETAICFGERHEVMSVLVATADEDAPVANGKPHWDLHEFHYPGNDGRCLPDAAAVLYVRTDGAAEDAMQAPRMIHIEVVHGETEIATRDDVFDPSASDFEVVLPVDELGDAPPAELCVRTTVIDLAGHRSEPSGWTCGPCHAIVERDGVLEWPGEPAWTPDTLVENGYCGNPDTGESTGVTEETSADDADASDASTNGPDVPTDSSSTGANGSTSGGTRDGALDRGCGCTSERRAQASWLLVPLVFVRRRARSRRS